MVWVYRQLARVHRWLTAEDYAHGTGESFTTTNSHDDALARDVWCQAAQYAEGYAAATERAGRLETAKAIRSIAQTFREQVGPIYQFHPDSYILFNGEDLRPAMRAAGSEWLLDLDKPKSTGVVK